MRFMCSGVLRADNVGALHKKPGRWAFSLFVSTHSNPIGKRNRREKMKNLFSDWADPGEWWFWLLIPITGTLWIIGEILALFGID
jgi:hypothetical protein